MQFEDPYTLLTRVEREMEGIPSEKLFNDPGYTKLHESWCAGMFGVGYSRHKAECTVAVNSSSSRLDVDFYLRAEGRSWEFQLAERQEPGRPRGLEYKEFASGKRKSIPYEPGRGTLEGPSWIAAAIQQKVQKHYAGVEGLNLLVYANFDALQMMHSEVVAACASNLSVFGSTWVLTSKHLCSLASSNSIGAVPGWRTIRSIQDYYLDE